MAKTALIIDDEPDITTYHGTLLEDNGWDVEVAHTADDGVAKAMANPPDVVLLDVMMPERGGLSTLVALRKDERTKEVPVVLITGVQEGLNQDFEKFLERIRSYHPDAYIEKPVNADALIETLERLTTVAS